MVKSYSERFTPSMFFREAAIELIEVAGFIEEGKDAIG